VQLVVDRNATVLIDNLIVVGFKRQSQDLFVRHPRIPMAKLIDRCLNRLRF
jgi:hypothetical protein